MFRHIFVLGMNVILKCVCLNLIDTYMEVVEVLAYMVELGLGLGNKKMIILLDFCLFNHFRIFYFTNGS